MGLFDKPCKAAGMFAHIHSLNNCWSSISRAKPTILSTAMTRGQIYLPQQARIIPLMATCALRVLHVCALSHS